VASVMRQMTLADEITLVEGHGTANPYVFYMPGVPRLCIPALHEEDGPAGVADGFRGVTELPAGVALAASWDPSLAVAYGRVIGSEEAGKGANVDLGPTVNIDRDPRWGRSFEAYSEDPRLNAALAVGTIDGVQRTGVMSQIKHLAAYNQETNRNTTLDDAIVSDRALHEIYLPAFQAAVERANVASVMCAYSRVNGSFSCNDRYLLTDTLKSLWGFGGFVTSDYGALHGTSGAVEGTDQEQPFDDYFGTRLQSAVRDGAIPAAALNTMVSRILTEMFRFRLFGRPPTGSPTATVTTAAHVALANIVAQDGTTLLKNAGGLLPLSRRNRGIIAVLGPSASASPTSAGGGSGYVIASQSVTPLQGLLAAAGTGTTLDYQQGLPDDSSLAAIPSPALSPAYSATPFGGSYRAALTAPESGTYVLSMTNPCGCYVPTYVYLDGRQLLDNPGTPPIRPYSVAVTLQAGHTYSLQINGESSSLAWATPSLLATSIAGAVAAAKAASAAIVVVSDDSESEAADRLSLHLPSAQDQLIEAVAAVNPHTIVVIDAGAPVAMPWLGEVAAVLDAWYPGQTNGTALADVLFGAVDPGGHLPVTFPARLSEVPAATPARFPGAGGKVLYSEGIDVGYRWYEVHDLSPLFPFGYGLSYTRFSFSNLRVAPTSADGVGDVHVSLTVTDVGHRAGADVAQLYLGDPRAAGEPPRQLVAFARVSLRAGRSARLRFTVTPRDTWWWDQKAGCWSQTAGTYQLYAGDSSALANLPLRGAFTFSKTPAARRLAVRAPAAIGPGRHAKIEVTLTASGDATLAKVHISLRPPPGWTVKRQGATVFERVSRSQAPTAAFSVSPPAWAPPTNEVIHATALLGPDAVREAGATLGVT